MIDHHAPNRREFVDRGLGQAVSKQTGRSLKDVRINFIERQPMVRFDTAAEVAGLAVFLAVDESSYITRKQYLIEGGMAL